MIASNNIEGEIDSFKFFSVCFKIEFKNQFLMIETVVLSLQKACRLSNLSTCRVHFRKQACLKECMVLDRTIPYLWTNNHTINL